MGLLSRKPQDAESDGPEKVKSSTKESRSFLRRKKKVIKDDDDNEETIKSEKDETPAPKKEDTKVKKSFFKKKKKGEAEADEGEHHDGGTETTEDATNVDASKPQKKRSFTRKSKPKIVDEDDILGEYDSYEASKSTKKSSRFNKSFLSKKNKSEPKVDEVDHDGGADSTRQDEPKPSGFFKSFRKSRSIPKNERREEEPKEEPVILLPPPVPDDTSEAKQEPQVQNTANYDKSHTNDYVSTENTPPEPIKEFSYTSPDLSEARDEESNDKSHENKFCGLDLVCCY